MVFFSDSCILYIWKKKQLNIIMETKLEHYLLLVD